MNKESGQEFGSDFYFEPAHASEAGGAEAKLEAIQITGNFAEDARSFLIAIGMGSKSLDQGDLVGTRQQLESLLIGQTTVEHLQTIGRDEVGEAADQNAMKRVLEEILKGK